MPEGRLARTRAAYRPVVRPCGHRNQMVRHYQIGMAPSGETIRIPLPSRFRARGAGARYCTSCYQVVDAQDDAEREAHGIPQA